MPRQLPRALRFTRLSGHLDVLDGGSLSELVREATTSQLFVLAVRASSSDRHQADSWTA
jgi:hypothetical protein